MTHTYCMTSNCTLAEQCARYEDDAGRHLLSRTIGTTVSSSYPTISKYAF